jgi:hypothetical protein
VVWLENGVWLAVLQPRGLSLKARMVTRPMDTMKECQDDVHVKVVRSFILATDAASSR